MRDGYLLLPRPGPCQRHDPFPRPCGDACRRMGGCTPLRLNRIRSVGPRDRRLRVRIPSGAFRGRRPVAGRPVRNGKVAGSNPAGSTTCGMPPRVSADIPGNDVMSRRRAPVMEYARQRPPRRPRRGCGAVAARLLPKQETAGSNPVIRSIREHWFSMCSIPRFRAGGPGDARAPGAGRQYAPYAPLVQRSEYRTFNPFVVVGSNPTGGTMLGTSPSISASIYYQIGCGSFFFRPRAKQGEENTQCDGPGEGL